MHYSDFKLGPVRPVTRVVPAGQKAVQVVAFAAARAGVGKTTLCANLGHLLAAAGRQVLLMDADPALPGNLGSLLGVNAEFTLQDVLSGRCTLDEIVVPAAAGVHIVPASANPAVAGLCRSSCAGLIRAFSDLSLPVDVLLIDVPAGTSECVIDICRAANEIVVISGNDADSLSESANLIRQLYLEYGVSRFRLLLNGVQSQHDAAALFRHLLQQFNDAHDLFISLCGHIPPYPALQQAVGVNQLLVQAEPDSPAARAFAGLAEEILGWPRPSQPGGHLEFFVERLIQNENTVKEARS